MSKFIKIRKKSTQRKYLYFFMINQAAKNESVLDISDAILNRDVRAFKILRVRKQKKT